MRLAITKARAGFTMIELLVVIAIIGVLAVAVLSSINPLEQIKKGQDTRRRSDAAQVLNALDRYFATKEAWPWGQPGDGGSYTGGPTAVTSTDLDALAAQDEVKQGFVTRLESADTSDKVYLYHTSSPSETLYSCFLAESKAFRDEACDASHTFLSSYCTSGDDNYYICLP